MYGHPMTPPKKRRHSKTYWVNGLTLLLTAAETQFHILQPLVPVNLFLVVTFTLPIVNLWLREVTVRPVGRIKPSPLPNSHEGSEPGA